MKIKLSFISLVGVRVINRCYVANKLVKVKSHGVKRNKVRKSMFNQSSVVDVSKVST